MNVMNRAATLLARAMALTLGQDLQVEVGPVHPVLNAVEVLLGPASMTEASRNASLAVYRVAVSLYQKAPVTPPPLARSCSALFALCEARTAPNERMETASLDGAEAMLTLAES